MKYVSTRDASIVKTFREALCSGYAPDGGLFVPQSVPKVDRGTLEEWSKLSFGELAFTVLRSFIADAEVPDEDLREICEGALSGFSDPDIIPVRKVGPIHVAELFHGPTYCFKDLGMRVLLQLLQYFSKDRSRTLLVSTTGDTGPAAVRAVVDGPPCLRILVHYPDGQISDFQRKQLTTIQSPRVKVVAFEGGGDDMDAPIKKLLAEHPDEYTGVNSYNIGRPLMQMVHFVWTYLRVSPDLETPLDIILPTGAMGNIAGGYLARQMGVPIGRLVAAVNANDISYRALTQGDFSRAPEMLQTLSEAINIQVPYNFERLLYYVTDGDHSLIKEWMTQMEQTQRLQLPDPWLSRFRDHFGSARVTDEDMCMALRATKDKFGYWTDPHTAVAFSGASQLGYLDQEDPVALLATASPCKFEHAVTVAVGAEGWTEYVQSDAYPGSAHTILQANEIPPVVYKARGSLLESLVAWEAQAKELLAEHWDATE